MCTSSNLLCCGERNSFLYSPFLLSTFLHQQSDGPTELTHAGLLPREHIHTVKERLRLKIDGASREHSEENEVEGILLPKGWQGEGGGERGGGH